MGNKQKEEESTHRRSEEFAPPLPSHTVNQLHARHRRTVQRAAEAEAEAEAEAKAGPESRTVAQFRHAATIGAPRYCIESSLALITNGFRRADILGLRWQQTDRCWFAWRISAGRTG